MEIKRIIDPMEEIRVMKLLDDALPIRLFERENCDVIVKRMTEMAIFYVAYEEQNEEPLGYVAFYANDLETKVAYITSICVNKLAQGSGVGGRLLEAAVSESKHRGMTMMKLEVLKSNANAIRFYKLKGFIQSGEKTNKSIYMEKEL